jgi:hypothetical protein
MKDLGFLQSNLYRSLITYQECTEILLNSLLSSRSLENIRLGAEWLKDIFAVDKPAAVAIAVKAAQEYYNSCSNFYDSDMDFAKECLGLIKSLLNESAAKQQGKQIDLNELNELWKSLQQEYDLIEASYLLAEEFDYGILPVQIRVSDDAGRFGLISDILKKKENAYKNYQKLIALADCLHLEDKNKVLLLIAEYSLDKNNLTILKEMTGKLMKEQYGQAWRCVHKLAYHLCASLAEQHKIANCQEEANICLRISQHKFNVSSAIGILSSRDKTIKQILEIESLLTFCLTYCDIEMIDDILAEKLSLEKGIFLK